MYPVNSVPDIVSFLSSLRSINKQKKQTIFINFRVYYDRANESPDEARWMLANALTVIADASMIDDIKRLLEDSRYTPERGVLRRALKKASAKQRRCKPA